MQGSGWGGRLGALNVWSQTWVLRTGRSQGVSLGCFVFRRRSFRFAFFVAFGLALPEASGWFGTSLFWDWSLFLSAVVTLCILMSFPRDIFWPQRLSLIFLSFCRSARSRFQLMQIHSWQSQSLSFRCCSLISIIDCISSSFSGIKSSSLSRASFCTWYSTRLSNHLPL